MKTTKWMTPGLVIVMGVLAASMAPAAEAKAGGSGKEPAWLAGKPLNEWFAVKGTGGSGGAPVGDFSGMTVKESASEIWIAAAGGHGGSCDNRVVSIDLQADAPAWAVRCPASTNAAKDAAYNPDGKPASRHTYQATLYVDSLDRVMLFGCRFTWPGAHEFPKVDGFDPKKNAWDPAGTYPEIPRGAGYGVVKDSLTGDVWTQGLWKWSAASNTWSNPITKRCPAGVRFPYAFDSKRGQLFGLNAGDGQGYGDMNVVSAIRVPAKGSESIQVTFTPGEALEQFKKDKTVYSGMDYDPDNDRFLFYNGAEKQDAGRIYVVKPNDTNVWELSLFTFGPGSTPPPAAGGAGVNNRFRYLPKLKGFVLLATRDSELYFIRTAGSKPVK